MDAAADAVIFVLAGVNGAGKSSVGGALLREKKLDYFNPDEVARRIRKTVGGSIDDANALAWQEGKRRLESAIEARSSYAFESTLGGNTIPRLLREAAEGGIPIFVWYTGLATLEQHIARVRARVASGGHDIPEGMIRQRWNNSRRNLIGLMPFLTELRVFDNSQEGDPAAGTIPQPRQLLRWREGLIVAPTPEVLATTPEWAMPIVVQALKLQRGVR
ncbi:MAG TPA: AAA family ATPase [Thermoanaerobaculia bacterium]|nr:AAA family ATPase [Thermoanaerobaculia bacterium]